MKLISSTVTANRGKNERISARAEYNTTHNNTHIQPYTHTLLHKTNTDSHSYSQHKQQHNYTVHTHTIKLLLYKSKQHDNLRRCIFLRE